MDKCKNCGNASSGLKCGKCGNPMPKMLQFLKTYELGERATSPKEREELSRSLDSQWESFSANERERLEEMLLPPVPQKETPPSPSEKKEGEERPPES